LASKYVSSLPPEGDFKPTNEQKLTFYKYFKQATSGSVKGAQPWAVQFEARAKWDAWNSVKGIGPEEARALYVAELEKVKPDWRADAAARGVTA